MPPKNIVQAEFLHVDGNDTHSLKALFERWFGKRVPIKTVARFFDESGALTNLVLRAGSQKLLDDQNRRLAEEVNALQEEARLLASKCLQEAIKTSSKVAIRRSSDHPFRLVQKDEEHELVELSRNARGVRLLVFRSNDLFDPKTFIASLM